MYCDKHQYTGLSECLECKIKEKDKKIEELEEEIKGYKTSLSAELLSLEQRDRIKAEERVKSLEEGIGNVKEEKDWDAKEFALIELYKLLEKKGKGE